MIWVDRWRYIWKSEALPDDTELQGLETRVAVMVVSDRSRLRATPMKMSGRGLEWSRPRKSKTQLDNSASQVGMCALGLGIRF
jgi:hypothetical protein